MRQRNKKERKSIAIIGEGLTEYLQMTQEEKWKQKYDEVVTFILREKLNPSKYDAEERGRYGNWLRHNRKLYNAGELKPERIEPFQRLLELSERYRRKNQYE